MRTPAPFCVVLRPIRWIHRAARSLPFAVAAYLGAWIADAAGATAVAQGGLAACILMISVAAEMLVRAEPSAPLLCWDGTRWRLPADGISGRLECVIDLGPWMLLRLRTERAAGNAGARDLWLQTGSLPAPTDEVALRAALGATGSRAVPPAALH